MLDLRRQRLRRQHAGLQGAGRALFHDGRQPRQLDRQPRAVRRSATCRSRISSAAPRSSSSRSSEGTARLGGLGAGRGACAGAGFSRWCDEAARSPRSAALERAARLRASPDKAICELGDHPRDRAPSPGSQGAAASYQRLEFLGDRVLGLVDLRAAVPRRFRSADEGELSQRLSALVRKETCADVAHRARSRRAHQARRPARPSRAGGTKPTILGDVCEAVIGAVFLDGGYEAARDLIERLLAANALHMSRSCCATPRPCCRNGRRRAACRRRSIAIVDAAGPDHEPRISSIARGDCRASSDAEGSGDSKRAAEQAAAAVMLAREGVVRER